MSLLQDFQICNIKIEKSTIAKQLEKEYSIEWGFNQDTPLDSFFHLRACVRSPITIKPGQILPIPTGIYPQLPNPNFRIECNSFTDLVYEQGICLADGISTFDFTFRNEIWLLLENKFKEAQTIQPTQKIALFSVNYKPRMVIEYVDWIEEIKWKNRSAKNFIQKIKKKMLPDIHDVKKQRQFNVGYDRDQIKKYIDGGVRTSTIRKKGGKASIWSKNIDKGDSDGS